MARASPRARTQLAVGQKADSAPAQWHSPRPNPGSARRTRRSCQGAVGCADSDDPGSRAYPTVACGRDPRRVECPGRRRHSHGHLRMECMAPHAHLETDRDLLESRGPRAASGVGLVLLLLVAATVVWGAWGSVERILGSATPPAIAQARYSQFLSEVRSRCGDETRALIVTETLPAPDYDAWIVSRHPAKVLVWVGDGELAAFAASHKLDSVAIAQMLEANGARYSPERWRFALADATDILLLVGPTKTAELSLLLETGGFRKHAGEVAEGAHWARRAP